MVKVLQVECFFHILETVSNTSSRNGSGRVMV